MYFRMILFCTGHPTHIVHDLSAETVRFSARRRIFAQTASPLNGSRLKNGQQTDICFCAWTQQGRDRNNALPRRIRIGAQRCPPHKDTDALDPCSARSFPLSSILPQHFERFNIPNCKKTRPIFFHFADGIAFFRHNRRPRAVFARRPPARACPFGIKAPRFRRGCWLSNRKRGFALSIHFFPQPIDQMECCIPERFKFQKPKRVFIPHQLQLRREFLV